MSPSNQCTGPHLGGPAAVEEHLGVALPSKPLASDSASPSTPAVSDTAAADDASPPPRSERPCAYITLLTRDSYLMGVQALARSLQAAQAQHSLLVMYTPDSLSQAAVAALEHEACQLLPIERYIPAGNHDASQYKLQLYSECWCKMRIWEMERYERLLYLDADMIVTRNIDHLFSLPPGFYACPDCTAGRQSQAEQDACPLFCPERPHYFNAGFFLTTPSRAELARFESLLAAGAVRVGGYAEQDLLNAVYKETWRPLPCTYNFQKGIRRHHTLLWQQLWPVAVLHYTDAKPWQEDQPENEKEFQDLVDLWWQAFGSKGPNKSSTAQLSASE